MDEITQQQAQTRLRTLHPTLRDTLSDPETYEKIAMVGKRYDLTRVEVGLLAQITGALMTGFLKPNEFVASVMDYLTVPRDTAILITQELNREIFNDVKEYLMKETRAADVPAAKSVKPQSIPTSALPVTSLPPPSVRPGGPIRSDWGWHGVRNEKTGQVEYKREMPSQVSTAGQTHVGSIFEQKLGGAFRMKGEAVQYEVHPVVPPKADTTGATQTPPPLNDLPGKSSGEQSARQTVLAAKPALHVPHKPTEIKIPPAQATQPPK